MLVSALTMRAPMHVGMHVSYKLGKEVYCPNLARLFHPPLVAFHFPISHPSLTLMTYACWVVVFFFSCRL